jgi:hypothetical protein
MEILSIKTMNSTVTEIIETTDHQKFILVQSYNNDGSELNYSVYDFKGVEVTNEPEIDEMMGRYFSVKSELESGLYSDEDIDDLDPFK